MTTVFIAVIVVVALVGYVFLMLRKSGIGQPGGKPDCGCGSGSSCKTHSSTKETQS